MGLLAALASLAAPMVARVLIALGFSVVTIGGIAIAWSTVLNAVKANLGATGAAYMQLAAIGGVWVALGAILGACTFVVTLYGLTRTVQILGAGA